LYCLSASVYGQVAGSCGDEVPGYQISLLAKNLVSQGLCCANSALCGVYLTHNKPRKLSPLTSPYDWLCSWWLRIYSF